MTHDDRHPRLGCGAAIVRDGQLLLIQRLRPPEAGCWSLPGGKVDWLETLADAVTREVREELGVVIHAPALLCIADQIDAGTPEHWAAVCYHVTRFDGEPALMEPQKHAAFGWFALTDLPEPLTVSARLAGRTLLERHRAGQPSDGT